jgi:pimeloyl-ACP methyl ester carboxylesterase
MAGPGEIRHRDLICNGVRLHVAEQGEGPLVLLCHGWPELWFSWRRQLPALAAVGCHAVAPDMRGFGRSDAPADTGAYNIMQLVGDMVALVAALGEKQAVIVGHDWGAPVAWHAALFRPDLFRAVAALSVPYRARGPAPPVASLRAAGMHRFYWVYFQEPGVAEAEFERDVAETMRRILATPGPAVPPRSPDQVLVLPEQGGFLDMMRPAETLPAWLGEDDLAVMVGEYHRTGFRGGLNYYRNLDRNWELTAPWQDAVVTAPRPVHRWRARPGYHRLRAPRAGGIAAQRPRPAAHPADRGRRPLDPAGAPGRGERGPASIPRRAGLMRRPRMGCALTA